VSQNPISSQYNYPLPKTTITASQVGTRILVSLGGSFQQGAWVEASNESPYIITIYSLQGILLNSIQPQICDIFQVPPGDTGYIIIPGLLIPQASPSSEVDCNVYPFGQPQGPYPFPLARQSTPTSRSSSAGFSFSFNFDATATNVFIAWLNVGNPTTSTLKFTFLAAYVYLAASTIKSTPNLEMGFYTGAPVISGQTPVPNNTTNVSQATAGLATNTNTGPGAGKVWYNNTILLPAGTVPVQVNLIPFPIQKEIPPNANFFIALFNSANEILGSLTAEWVEA